MRELEKVLRAVANRRRLAILKYLKEHKEASVGELAGAIRLSFKSTSRHLAILTSVDILEKDQRSIQMFYSLAGHQHAIARYLISLI